MPSSRNVMFLLICCYALWGGGLIAMKYAFASFAVLQVVFCRVAFAAVFYLALYPRWRHLPYRKGDWKYLVALVAFEPCLFFLFETFSLHYTTASQGGIIAACFPICTAIAAWLFLGERLGKRMIIAIIFAVVGVAGSSWFAHGDAKAANPLLGNLLMFGAVLSSTGYAVCVRYVSRRYSFLAVSAIQALGGTLVFLPLIFMAPPPQRVTPAALAGLLYMGIGVGIVVYLLFNYSLQHLKAGVVALLGNLIPVFTLIFASALLGERLTLPQLGFACLTIAGVLVATGGDAAHS